MAKDLLLTLNSSENIPEKIGDYCFEGIVDFDDETIQLRYEGEQCGFFTITIYKRDIEIPGNLGDQILTNEFEDCVNVIFWMEDEKKYQNVEMVVKEPFYFDNETDPKFLSAIFRYDRCLEDDEYLNEVSILFLRSDNGFFHKIRYSVSIDASGEVMDKFEFFLMNWLAYISTLGDTIN